MAATTLQRDSDSLRSMPAPKTSTADAKAQLGRILIPFHVIAIAMLAALTLLPGAALG